MNGAWMTARTYAKGGHKSGMNKTEARYAKYLEGLKQAGEIQAYGFEDFKVKIADKACWYTPDFWVWYANGELQFHEVKGSRAIFMDDAKVKVKVCASTYPPKVKVVFPTKNGGWEYEEY